MTPGVANESTNQGATATTPLAPPHAEHVVIDEATPLVSVVVHDDSSPEQEIAPVCQDMTFAVLFAIHAAAILFFGIFTAPKGFQQLEFNVTSIEDEIRKQDDVTDEDMQEVKQFLTAAIEYVQVYPARIVLYIVVPCGLLAYAFGVASTAVVIKPCPRVAVYGCLISSVVLLASLMVMSAIASGSTPFWVLTAFAVGALLYYVSMAWKMVPFAAVNLKIALEGMGRNSGMYIVAFLFAELGFVWVLFWIYVVVGTSAFQNHQCMLKHPDSNFDMESDDYDDSCDPPVLVVIFFLLSLYWTNTIIMNTVQVTVAGVMATWCFDKTEADGCCSPAIQGSVFRSLTYSFGSICFGSLLQAIMSVFRYLVESARNQRDRDNENFCGTILLCILECLARLLEDIVEYFNQWAYVFVGIYGYSYLESGRRVMELFRAKGFTTIVTDTLVGYVLVCTEFTVALLTGAVGVLIEATVTKSHSAYLEDGESHVFGLLPAAPFAFGVSFAVGLWIASVMMNVVKGAVNTLIVCWADNPAVMEVQHPTLMKELADAWSDVFSTPVSALSPAVIV